MDKMKEIIQLFNNYYYVNIDKNNLTNILDNLTYMERNIIFNKLYYDNDKIYNYTFLQKIYSNCSDGSNILIDLLKKYKDNININVKNSEGKTLLFYITFYRDIKILKLIYELYKDVNINILNNDSENLLYYIIRYGCYNEKIIRYLLEKNVKIQYKLLKYMIDLCDYENMNILLEYLRKNDNCDYILEELYKYVIENKKINEDNEEFFEKLFAIKSNTKSAAKVLAKILNN